MDGLPGAVFCSSCLIYSKTCKVEVRTAKDGILSGLNNLDIYTMLDKDFADKFGFTGKEVDELLIYMDCVDKKEEITSWYNGYFVGTKYSSPHKVFNPWSVLKYLKAEGVPETYWANTGSTNLLERLITETGESTQKEFKLLLEDGSLKNKQINQDVILLELDKKNAEPWSFLFFAGYLTASQHVFYEDKHLYTLSLPNKEIADLLKKLTINTLNASFTSNKLQELLEALMSGMEQKVSKLLEEFVQAFCSFHDLSHNALEKSLHMFVLGLLASLSERYVIKSNLESGDGRYDILMHPKKEPYLAIIIEFKKGKNRKLEKLAIEALQQIREKNYAAQIREFGYHGTIFCYGIAVYQKQLVAKMETL
ncbi:MAG: hypothetical protein FJZ58_02675 [Chlamydiae bacterium]|nr:hypothetical protein [Chlamydiota bacterium]